MNKKVYIIILNYNGWKDTIECLESILKSDYNNYQIIVVDNNSPNNSMNYLIKWAKGELCLWLPDNNPLKRLSFPLEKKPIDYVLYRKEKAINGGDIEKESKLKNPIIFIQAGENRGFAAGNNIGIKYALAKNDFEYVWLLNNDTVIEKDTLKKFVNSFENKKKEENIGVLGSVQYYYDFPNEIQAVAGGFDKKTCKFWNYKLLDIKRENISYIYGASMFIDKKILFDVGLLNEDYFLYYEEIDLTERLKRKDYIIDIDKSIKIYHKHSKSIKNIFSLKKFLINFKSKRIFCKNYYPQYMFNFYYSIIKDFLNSLNKKLKK